MTSQRAYAGSAALLFAACAAVTIVWCNSMAAMDGMAMPWMRMPGQSWPDATVAYLCMWSAMSIAMMLPSLVPMLARYRQAAGNQGTLGLGPLTLMVGGGYFLVWTLIGLATYPLGVLLAGAELRWPALARAAPLAVGVVVLIGGALQFSAWKARQLACCRQAPRRGSSLRASGSSGVAARAAFRHGLRLGLHCSSCCAGLTSILLVIGVMDLRAMACVTAAITFERLAPASERAARFIGIAIIAMGLVLTARAALTVAHAILAR